ncbi:MAG TPA: HEAT repeat domain-containing protein [Bacteroidota bacterium]|nr:HEAT repeat domain-containing protein [Bacteroidota bacterium]
MKLIMMSVLAAMLFVPGSCIIAQGVRKAPATAGKLGDRWSWALSQAGEAQFKQGGWIAYSIDRLMGEDSWVGSHRTYPGSEEVSLYETITGVHIENPADDLRDAARKALSRSERKRTEKKVMKEVAFLFRFSDPSAIESQIQEVQPTNMNLSVDLEGLPLIWLGKASTEESLDLLRKLFQKSSSMKQKRRVIMAYGMHDSPAAFGLLKAVVEGNDQTNVRRDAAFWIGQQNSSEALEFLTKTARNEASQDVAEQAVFAISQIGTEASTDVLIDLGKNGPHREVRKKAVFWLGQQASERVVETLKDFAYNNDDVEVQKQAVFALTQIHGNGGLSEIIRIAKTHPNPKIRKQAIFWLGQSDDPKAFETIVEIAKGK